MEQMTDDDRGYRGSRFAEVRDAIFANPYQTVWGRAGQPPMPQYKVSLRRFAHGILPFGQPFRFRQAAERTVDSHADLRWGTNRGFQRIRPLLVAIVRHKQDAKFLTALPDCGVRVHGIQADVREGHAAQLEVLPKFVPRFRLPALSSGRSRMGGLGRPAVFRGLFI